MMGFHNLAPINAFNSRLLANRPLSLLRCARHYKLEGLDRLVQPPRQRRRGASYGSTSSIHTLWLPWPWMAPVADHHVVRVHRVRLEDARALSQVEHRLERSTAGSRKKASGHGPSTHRDAGEKHMKYYSTHRGHHTYVCSHVSAVLRNIKIQKSKCMSRI